MDDILFLREISADNSNVLGKKATYLAELYNKKFSVPPAFVITGEFFVKYTQYTNLKEDIGNILNSNVDIGKKSHEIQKKIVNSNFPGDMGDFVYENYNSLNVEEDNTNNMISSQQEPYVALRVSSTEEKVDDAFFLNIRGRDRLLNAIKACWASLFSKENIGLKKFKPSIVVQKMVNSKKSGYIYTANPSTGNPEEIVIDVCSGMGNGLSINKIEPSRYILSKAEFEVKSSELKEQSIQYALDFSQQKTVRLNLDEPVRNIMDEYIIRELAKAGKMIESRLNSPQKVIFAIDKKIHILSSKDLVLQKDEAVKEQEITGQQDNKVENMVQYDQDDNRERDTQRNTSGQDFQTTESSEVREEQQNIGQADAGHEESNSQDYPHRQEQQAPTEEQPTSEPRQETFDLDQEFDEEENLADKDESLNQDENRQQEQDLDIPKEENPKDYESAIEMSDDSLEHYDQEHGLTSSRDENFMGEDNIDKVGQTQEHTQPKEQATLKEALDSEEQTRLSQDNNYERDFSGPQDSKDQFMEQYMNSKPELLYQRAISFNSSMLVVSCDMTILSSLKNKYKSVFSRDSHNYFNELINELKMRVNIPYESEIKQIRKLRDQFLNEFRELTPEEISFVLKFTRKFLAEF